MSNKLVVEWPSILPFIPSNRDSPQREKGESSVQIYSGLLQGGALVTPCVLTIFAKVDQL